MWGVEELEGGLGGGQEKSLPLHPRRGAAPEALPRAHPAAESQPWVSAPNQQLMEEAPTSHLQMKAARRRNYL